jgi:uncharacterized lipoprotein
VKIRLIALLVSSSLLSSGCSVFSGGVVNAKEVLNDFGGGGASATDYRETQDALVTPLEIPPELSVPEDMSPKLAQVAAAQAVTPKSIATFDKVEAKGITLVQNDCARFAKIDMPLNEFWLGLTQFLSVLELPVESSDVENGLMVTEFVERKNLVPKDAQPFLTELFNRASPKKAEDYFDKYTFRLEHDALDKKGLRVYVSHEAMQEQESGTDWKQMPPEPERAAMMLNQLIKFFALQQAAKAQADAANGQ